VLVIVAGLALALTACGGDDGGESSATSADEATTTTAGASAAAGDFDEVVDVDGRGMHLVCSGEGDPMVLVAMGGDSTIADWDFARSELDNDHRTCVYERAGVGSSEPGPEPRTAQVIADELAGLLTTVDVDEPVVVVSHSVGGLFTQAFAQRHPDAVLGLVFLEPRTAAYQVGYRDHLTPAELRIDQRDLDDAIANASFGPELAALDDGAAEVVDAGPLPDVPVVVLTAGVPFPGQSTADRDFWVQTHVDLAAQVTEGFQRIVENADHQIFRTNPQDVAAAVAEVTAG